LVTIPWEKRKPLRAGILLGGDLYPTRESDALLASCDLLVVADSGAAYARNRQLVPDLAVGDFDSIDPADLEWLQAENVPCYSFARDKDETDSELAAWLLLTSSLKTEKIDAAQRIQDLNNLSLIRSKSWDKIEPRADLELLFLGSTGSRPDHMLANIFLARKLVEKNIPVLLTDGISLFVLLSGSTKVRVKWPRKPDEDGVNWLFSSLVLSDQVTGLTYTGAAFPLTGITLERGTSLGLSNRGQDSRIVDFGLRIASGSLLIIVTRED